MTQAPDMVLETAIYAGDLDAAEAFYGGVLGLERLSRGGSRHVFYRVGAGVLLIFDPTQTEVANLAAPLQVPPHGARGPGHLCFRAEPLGLDGWRARLQAAGLAIEDEIAWPNGARSIYLRDPAGNSVEFAEARLWDPP